MKAVDDNQVCSSDVGKVKRRVRKERVKVSLKYLIYYWLSLLFPTETVLQKRGYFFEYKKYLDRYDFVWSLARVEKSVGEQISLKWLFDNAFYVNQYIKSRSLKNNQLAMLGRLSGFNKYLTVWEWEVVKDVIKERVKGWDDFNR